MLCAVKVFRSGIGLDIECAGTEEGIESRFQPGREDFEVM